MNEIEKQLVEQYGKDFVEWIKHDLFKKMDKSKSKRGKGMGHLQNQHKDLTDELKDTTDRLSRIPMTGENQPRRRRLADRVDKLKTNIEKNVRDYSNQRRKYAEVSQRQRELYAERRKVINSLESGEGTEEERAFWERKKTQLERAIELLGNRIKIVGAGENDDDNMFEGGRSAGAIVRAIMGKNKKAFQINKMKTITKASIKDAKPKQAQSIIRKVIEKRGQTYDNRGLTDNPMYNTSYSTLRRKELEGSKEKQGRLDKAKNYKYKKGLVKKDVASFSKYSVKELKQLAKNMNVKGITGKKKHELVEMVREAYNNQIQEGGAFGDALWKAFRF